VRLTVNSAQCYTTDAGARMSSAKAEQPGFNRKKEYQRPQLVCYGDVALVTRGSKGDMSDAGSATGGMTMPCWVAEVLYGVQAPRTQLVRSWLMECYEQRKPWALIVVPLYRRVGRRVATAVQRYSFIAGVLRPLFDSAVRRSLRYYAGVMLAVTPVPTAR
jgi:hypothetical protein